MKNHLFIESLEPRVAPAVLVNGGNLLGGNGNPTTGETSTGGNTVTLVKVTHGQALVFFDSTLHTITSISVGKNAQLDITGNITGDIVTNLLPTGRLTDSDNDASNGEDGGILLGTNIKGITTHVFSSQNGDINRIIAGGTVKNVNISGQLKGLYAGDGIFRDGPTAVVSTHGVDYNSILTGAQTNFVLTQAQALPYTSANVNKVVVATANQLEIFAGGGHTDAATGLGQAGGNITNVTIRQTLTGEGSNPALFLHAGDGGAGSTGGAGGNVANFDDMGSIAYVRVQTGDGGGGDGGAGGAGGFLNASTIVTSSPRYDLFMGRGGDGATVGGAGGTITTLNFTNDMVGGKSFVTLGDFNGDGLQDVLLTNTLTGEATLSLGKTNADGTAGFSVALQTAANGAATPFIAAVGAVPTTVVASDFNADGNLDFVVSYASTNNLGVFLGHGNGTFTASSVALTASPTRITVSDFGGTAAPDIAVLSAGDITSAGGGTNSQIFLVQNDGAARFTALGNPTTISGLGTDIAAAQIDKAGTNDVFVGLASGNIDTLFGTGTAFNLAATFNAFPSAVTSLDVGPTSDTTTMLLAFDVNINSANASVKTIAPQIDVFNVGTSGSSPGMATIQPTGDTASAAHFVQGTEAIGVVGTAGFSIYSYQTNGYAVLTSLASTGVLNDFTGIADANGYQIAAVGAATNRFFYTAGNPGSTTGLPAFDPINTPFEPRIISFVAGDGGHGAADHGGAGGGVNTLTYNQTLGGGVLEAGGTYEAHVTTGSGGDSDRAKGGKAGDLDRVTLTLASGDQNESQDDTTSVFLTTGHGGAGTDGGAGGNITKVKSTSVFAQTEGSNAIVGAVTMQMTTGDGGRGAAGTGGAGGSVTLDGPSSLSGVTFFDVSAVNPEAAALQVRGGNGGDGISAGGAGGALTGVGAQNAIFGGNLALGTNELASAFIASGNGGNATAGNGGAGGGITGLNLAVQNLAVNIINPATGIITQSAIDGAATVISGSGGNGAGGLGGNAGVISKSSVASLTGDVQTGYGVLLASGLGGDGSLGGGKGGDIKKLTMNTASTNEALAAVLVAGDGGAATEAGAGGRGGTIKGIAQSKDVNSTINTLQAGSGGASASGEGGAGGSVKAISTAGFIGLPSITTGSAGIYLGVFDSAISSPVVASFFATGSSVPQGIFAGCGGDGATNGSVLNVVARQIAAIAATVGSNGTFAAANQVNNISADLIGYDVNHDGIFDSTQPGRSPAQARPVDGFLLATNIGTLTITSGDGTRIKAFEFTS